jgi:hypothetical protein
MAKKKAAKKATPKRVSTTKFSVGPVADHMDSVAGKLRRVGTPTSNALATKLESLAQTLRSSCQVSMTIGP